MNLLHDLRNLSSTIDKSKRLKAITLNEWKTFIMAYNPYLLYRMKWPAANIARLGEPCNEMFTLLDDILDRKYIGTEAMSKVESFAKEHGDLIKLVINHDLKCGVSATLFNKVHPTSIPVFNVQLAKEVPLFTINYPVLAQLKYDGIRIIAINNEGDVIFRTRNGKEVQLPELKKILEAAPAVNFILDGEMTLKSGKQEDRTKVSGMINSAMHGGIVMEKLMLFNVFDTMSLSEWESCSCDKQYSIRFAHALSLVKAISSDRLDIARTTEVGSEAELNLLYTDAIENGYEGLIIKHELHLYTFKRSKDWVKLKETKSADLKCIGVIGGTGKYEGMIGALTCLGTVEDKEVLVNVGTGLSDIERSLPASSYMFRTIEVKYNATIQDSITKKHSLFLPRFVEVRIDK